MGKLCMVTSMDWKDVLRGISRRKGMRLSGVKANENLLTVLKMSSASDTQCLVSSQ